MRYARQPSPEDEPTSVEISSGELRFQRPLSEHQARELRERFERAQNHWTRMFVAGGPAQITVLRDARVEWSWRYMVVGLYKDRDRNLWRIFLPFVRINVGQRMR